MNLFIADLVEYKRKVRLFASGNRNLILLLFFIVIPAEVSGVISGIATLSQYVIEPKNAIKEFYLSSLFLLIYIIYYSIQKQSFPIKYSNSFISSLLNKKQFFFYRIAFMIYSAIPISIFFFMGLLSKNSHSLEYIIRALSLVISLSALGFLLYESNKINVIIISLLFILFCVINNSVFYSVIQVVIILVLSFFLFVNDIILVIKNKNSGGRIPLVFLSPYVIYIFDFISTRKVFVITITTSIVFFSVSAYFIYQQMPEKINDVLIVFFSIILYISMILFYNLSHFTQNNISNLISFTTRINLIIKNYFSILAVFIIVFMIFLFFLPKHFLLPMFVFYSLLSIVTSIINILKSQYTKLITLFVIVLFSCLLGYLYA